MSVSSGSFTPSTADSNAGAASRVVSLDNAANGGAGVLISLGPGESYTGATIFNMSADHYLRIDLTTTGTAVGDGLHLIPPRGTASFSFDADVITGWSAQLVNLPAVAGTVNVSTLAVATLTGIHAHIVNLVNA